MRPLALLACLPVFLDVLPVPNAPLGNVWREIRVEACPAWTGVEVRVSGRLYQEIETRQGPERFYLGDGQWKVMASEIAHATATQALQ